MSRLDGVLDHTENLILSCMRYGGPIYVILATMLIGLETYVMFATVLPEASALPQ